MFKKGMMRTALFVIAGAVFSGAIMGILGKIPGVGPMLANLGGGAGAPAADEEGEV